MRNWMVFFPFVDTNKKKKPTCSAWQVTAFPDTVIYLYFLVFSFQNAVALSPNLRTYQSENLQKCSLGSRFSCFSGLAFYCIH